ncbi:flagellar hook-associated protein FlgK [Photobacterium toruni]|uniref:flagellar hook-associated protein FlgK n=1 Tax=Photobacterium toruni TaxID=1935446 RepID=UPI0021100F1F|nr:flagellar basal body rod C-terminal domain-containing protein [Photobacterium toruni]
MSNMINRAQQALSGFMTGASVTSKNIQHAADTNFARETVKFTTGSGGQLIVNIQRMSDSFLSTRLNMATSRNAAASSAYQATSQIDKLITGSTMTVDGKYENLLQSSITHMSSSWDTLLVKDTPSARKSIIADMDQVRININDMAHSLHQQQSAMNSQIKTSTSNANKLLKQAAELNNLISKTDPGDSLNDLLNRQESLVRNLSNELDVNTRFGNDGTVRIELKSGMALVDGDKYRDLSIGQSEFSHDYAVFVNGKIVSDNPQLLGGKIGGQFEVRDGALAEAQRKIGLMSATITNAYNEANRKGFTADNQPGKDLLTAITAGALPSKENIGDGNLLITIDPKGNKALSADSYTLTKTPTGFEVYNNNTKALMTSSANLPIKIGGLNISISTGVVMTGDRFLIDPMKTAAEKFEVVGTDKDIAISSKSPAVSGDNGNAYSFINIRNDKMMLNGSATITEGLASIFVDIGINSATALSKMQTSSGIFDSANEEWGAYSGVNLEEERVSLLGYEKNYQAASKIVQTSQKLWSSILEVIG